MKIAVHIVRILFGPAALYSSTNLTDWTPIATNPPTFGTWDFSDPSTNAALKFYRASQTQ